MFEELKKRSLKITEALYRTTDLFYDGEPLKWSLRESALAILDAVSSLNSSSYQEAKAVSVIEQNITNISIKLELAGAGSFISKANFEVLAREYSLLIKQIDSNKEKQYQNLLDNILSDKLLSDKPNAMVGVEAKLRNESAPRASTTIIRAENILVSDRKRAILKTLKDKGRSGVGDIASIFNGSLSEKTIQRELNSLVGQGLIRQDGEKRWRRYFVELNKPNPVIHNKTL